MVNDDERKKETAPPAAGSPVPAWQLVYNELNRERLRTAHLRTTLITSSHGLARVAEMLEKFGATSVLLEELRQVARSMVENVGGDEGPIEPTT